MRVGTNPQKEREHEHPDFYHQVIIPVYIPELAGYFSDALKIFELCLSSLFSTIHSKTFVTVVNNGSCSEVCDYLDVLYKKGSIHELVHTSNIGKVNAVFKGLTGHSFPVVTISDSDVLFLAGWQSASYKIFEAFPKAGAVATTPNSRGIKYQTANIFFDLMFSPKLKFTPVRDPDGMKAFVKSIGRDAFLREAHLKKNLTVTQNNATAIAGAGHYVCTYRGEIFRGSGFSYATGYVGGSAMEKFIDSQVLKKGFWRLSTEQNYTYHMGNVYEQWMSDKVSHQQQHEIAMPRLEQIEFNPFMSWLRGEFFSKIIHAKKIWPLFLWHKGLKRQEAGRY